MYILYFKVREYSVQQSKGILTLKIYKKGLRFVCKALIFLFLLVNFSAFRTRYFLMMERLVSSTKSCIFFFNR